MNLTLPAPGAWDIALGQVYSTLDQRGDGRETGAGDIKSLAPLAKHFPRPARIDVTNYAPPGAPYIPDGTSTSQFYDAISYSTNRVSRPYFSTDSRYTLNSWTRRNRV